MDVSETPAALLVSGGLDSAVLLGRMVRDHKYPAVHPIYVRCGLAWEAVERQYLDRYLAAIAEPVLRPLITLEMPVADLYGEHWSLTGRGVPGADTPDEAVYLPGRNVLLLSKAMIWCHLNKVPRLSLAVLAGNPFEDAAPGFLGAYEDLVDQAIGGEVEVGAPFADSSKADVIREGRDLPLQHTLSCLRPVGGRHCGRCNKCAERRAAFVTAGVPDPTEYSEPVSPRGETVLEGSRCSASPARSTSATATGSSIMPANAATCTATTARPSSPWPGTSSTAAACSSTFPT